MPPEPRTDWLDRLRTGDQQAAAEVVQLYTDRLLRLARKQFDTWLRDRADPEGIVQSVYRSFFGRCRDRTIERRGDGQDLWPLLAAITVRKCHNRYEKLRARKRDGGREQSLPGSPDEHGRFGPEEPLDREPTPEEALLLVESVERLLSRLDPLDLRIAEMSLQGYEVAEISVEVHRAERTVRSVRQFLRERLERMNAESA
jgi:RNA polymerase sigma-70 factor (ECF subfamily)